MKKIIFSFEIKKYYKLIVAEKKLYNKKLLVETKNKAMKEIAK